MAKLQIPPRWGVSSLQNLTPLLYIVDYILVESPLCDGVEAVNCCTTISQADETEMYPKPFHIDVNIIFGTHNTRNMLSERRIQCPACHVAQIHLQETDRIRMTCLWIARNNVKKDIFLICIADITVDLVVPEASYSLLTQATNMK